MLHSWIGSKSEDSPWPKKKKSEDNPIVVGLNYGNRVGVFVTFWHFFSQENKNRSTQKV
jgi:hypothetical protein